MGTQGKVRVYWLSWAAVGFACVASAVQSFAPLWFFIALIVISQITTGIGILVVTRRAKRAELEWKMEKAFGKPKPKFGDPKYRAGNQF